MSEMTAWSPQGQSVADYSGRAVERLGEWANSANAAYGIAERLVESSFVPQQFKGKPVEAAAAILAGVEVGLQPMAALRSFDIIQGTAAARAITLRAIVQSHGHEIQQVEATSSRCVMQGRRRGSQEWQKVTWTIDRARDLGLIGKDNWKKQPQAMLVARATSEIARLIAADAILGIGYSIEEVQDGAAEYIATEPEEPRPARTLRRKPAAQAPAPDEPAVDASDYVDEAVEVEVVEAGPTESDPEPASDDQVEEIKSIVGSLGWAPTKAKAVVQKAAGRPDARTDNLTAEEATNVLTTLWAELPSAEADSEASAETAIAAARAGREHQGALDDEVTE